MKTTRKIISLLIVLAFILSAFPMPVAFAEGEEYEEINVNDEKVITVNEELDGTKMFAFTAEKTGSYKIFSCNTDLDPKCTLFNSLMEEISYADDTNKRDFLIVFDLNEGETVYIETSTYYRDQYGEYTVKLVEVQAVTAIAFEKESVTGSLGDRKELALEFEPEYGETGDIYWSVDDSGIVKIIDEYQTYCVIDLVGEGEATVTATNDNGISASCTITVEAPEEILPEEVKEIVVTEENRGINIFKFVSENGGRYEFCSFNNDFDTYGYIYNDKMEELYTNDDDGIDNNFSIIFTAEANTVYYLKARPYYSDVTEGKYSVKVSELVAAQDISLTDERIHGAIGSSVYNEVIFSPENAFSETVTLEIDDESVAKIDGSWNGGRSFDIVFVGGGTTTLTATTESGLTATCEISVDEPTEISLGEEIAESTEDNIFNRTYKFVPEEDGVYKFDENVENASYSLNLWDSEFNHISSSSWMEVALTAGETYYYNINAEKASAEDYIEFSLVISHCVPATGITLSETEIKGKVATYETINLEFLPENAIEEDITWTSSNESAVEIYSTWNNNKTCEVKIVGKGSSVITAESESGFTASCTVTADQIVDVKVDEVHTRYEEDGYSYTYMFQPEETGTYMFDFTCVNAYIDWSVIYDGDLSWLDSPSGDFQYEFTAGETYYINPDAYVDYNSDEGDESYISLTVTKLVPAESIVLSEESVTGKIGESVVLEASFTPENAIDEDITWTSSDESVAIVYDTLNDSKSCEIQLVGVGTAIITATSENGATDTCTIMVEDVPEIILGDTALIKDEDGFYSGNVNYYKFIPEEDGIYKFTVSGENTYDEYVYVWNADYSVDESDFTSVQETLTAGETYYCKASAPIDDYDYTSSATLTIEKLIAPTSLEIDRESYTGTVAQYVLIKASLGPEGCASEYIEWSSSDTSAAQIDNWWDDGYCRIFLSGTGTVTITAESRSGLVDTCTITVNEPSEISLNEEKSLSTDTDGMATGSYKFVAEEDGVYAFYSFDNDYDTYGYVYDSEGYELSDDDDGGEGNNFFATFEATAGEIYYLSARPYSRDAEGEYSVSVKKVIKATSISFKEQNVLSRIGSTKEIYVLFGPDGAIPEGVNFTSSDESVVEVLYNVEGDEGKGCFISFVEVGTATITATSENGLTATCTVTVEDIPELTLGNTSLVINENGYYSSTDNYFKFIPEEDGTYKFTVSGVNTFDENVYLWKDELEEEGYPSLSHKLVAGQTYYVRAYADVDDIDSESSAVITVEKLQPPTSMTLIPEKTTGIISDEITVDVVFGPQGCANEDFSWEISDESILDARSGGEDYVDFFATGAGEATITFTSDSGLIASCKITISEPGIISLDETKEISTENNCGHEIFKFVPEEDGVYGFYSFDSEMDTYGYAFDSDLIEITNNDDGENTDFLVQFDAMAGNTYYLKARPYSEEDSGTYFVSVKKYEEPTVLRLSKMSFSGSILDRFYLDATFGPVNAYSEEVTWSSSDESVAKVLYPSEAATEIRLVGAGNAIITATTESGLKATCTVTSEELEEITLEKGSTVSFKNGYCTGAFKFVPEEDGVYRFGLSRDFADSGYAIYNAEDVTTSEDYNGSGEFKLAAGQVYYCSFDIWDRNIEDTEVLDFAVTRCSKATSMTLSQDSVEAKITQDIILEAQFGPDGAASENVSWSTSDSSVVQIEYSENNRAELWVAGIGTATITATSESGLTSSCVVTGKDATSVESDMEEAFSLDSDTGYQVYKFTAEKNATYRIYSTESNLRYAYIRIYNSDLEWVDSSSFDGDTFNSGFHAVSGETYYICFRVESNEDNCSCKFKISTQTAATSIALGEEAISGSKYGSTYCTYELLPLNAAREEVIWTSSNPDVVYVENGYLYFKDIGIATITVSTRSGLTDSVTVMVSQPSALELDVPKEVKTTGYGHKVVYSFVPETSGYYSFTSISDNDTFGELHDSEFSYIAGSDDSGEGYNFLITNYLEAGKVYYLSTHCYSSASVSYSVVVTKALEGDVNDDGVVDIYDYQQLVNLAVLTEADIKEQYGETTFSIADLNNDGAVDVLDAWKLSLIVNNQ